MSNTRSISFTSFDRFFIGRAAAEATLLSSCRRLEFLEQILNHPSKLQPDNNQAQIFDRPGPQNQFPQQTFDSLGGLQPNPVPINPVLAPPQFGYPPYAPKGTQQFYGALYDMLRPDSTQEVGSKQGSLLGFTPGPAGAMNFAENYPRPWNLGPATGHFERPLVGQGDYGYGDFTFI
ncbi:E3 ubiquitin-protein ligase [Forsythia ovata]|uniref:E3 ubiquitin-protein ligase n=1 Tax=Forsythia ovata TaxID=205694 RepID=A0ABD1WTY4_9LAMI